MVRLTRFRGLWFKQSAALVKTAQRQIQDRSLSTPAMPHSSQMNLLCDKQLAKILPSHIKQHPVKKDPVNCHMCHANSTWQNQEEKKIGGGHIAWHIIQSSLRKRHNTLHMPTHVHLLIIFTWCSKHDQQPHPALLCQSFFFVLFFIVPRCPHFCKHSQTDYHCNSTALLQRSHRLHQALPLMVALILFLLWVKFFSSHRGNRSMELIFSLWCRKDWTARKQYRQREYLLG